MVLVECEVSSAPGPGLYCMEDNSLIVPSRADSCTDLAKFVDEGVTSIDVHPVRKGMIFTREVMKCCERFKWDGFGENGEFHSLAKVWTTSPEQALGF